MVKERTFELSAMKGKDLERKVRECGVSKTELANRLGISLQTLHGRLSSDNVSTKVLEDIAQALGKPVCYFYNEYPILSVEDAKKVAQMEARLKFYEDILSALTTSVSGVSTTKKKK